MGTRDRHRPGTFSWVDLTTTDADGAQAFYGPLFDWTFEAMRTDAGTPYVIARRDGHDVAGLAADPQQPPHWNSYVTVDDAAAAAEHAQALGATIVAPAFDAMDAGRMAVIQDPVGAFLCVWEPRASIGAALVNAPGALTWNELVTREVEAARRFYGDWLGWTIEAMPGGEGYLVIRNVDRLNGGILPHSPEMGADMPSSWTPYFGVDDVEAALDRVRELGGQLLVEPEPMPNGAFAVIADPQGAVCSLWSGQFDD